MKYFLTAFVSIAISLLTVFFAMPNLILETHSSKYDFQTTIDKINLVIEENNWSNSGINKISESVVKHGAKAIPPVAVIKICQANHASAILQVEAVRKVSAIMPCSISVYEKDDGSVEIAHFNTWLMGAMFPSPVKEIMMGDVSKFMKKVDKKISSEE